MKEPIRKEESRREKRIKENEGEEETFCKTMSLSRGLVLDISLNSVGTGVADEGEAGEGEAKNLPKNPKPIDDLSAT